MCCNLFEVFQLVHKMNFDTSSIDAGAPCVVADPLFRLDRSDVLLMGLPFHPAFESAPDDEVGWTAVGKSKRFAASFEEGRKAEDRFEAAAAALGWTRVPTSSFDDKVRRIDAAYTVPFHGFGTLLLDIKGAKKLSRSDPEPQFRFHWLELHDTGSLFSGQSAVLALEVGPGRFALFNKGDLRMWIRAKVQGPPVARSTQALFRPYQRDGKLREWITLVDVKEMASMCKGIL